MFGRVSKRDFELLEYRVEALEGKKATTLEPKNPDINSTAGEIILLAHQILMDARDIYHAKSAFPQYRLNIIRDKLELAQNEMHDIL